MITTHLPFTNITVVHQSINNSSIENSKSTTLNPTRFTWAVYTHTIFDTGISSHFKHFSCKISKFSKHFLNIFSTNTACHRFSNMHRFEPIWGNLSLTKICNVTPVTTGWLLKSDHFVIFMSNLFCYPGNLSLTKIFHMFHLKCIVQSHCALPHILDPISQMCYLNIRSNSIYIGNLSHGSPQSTLSDSFGNCNHSQCIYQWLWCEL